MKTNAEYVREFRAKHGAPISVSLSPQGRKALDALVLASTASQRAVVEAALVAEANRKGLLTPKC